MFLSLLQWVLGCRPRLRTSPDSRCILLAWCSVHCDPNGQLLSWISTPGQTSYCNGRYTILPGKEGLLPDTFLGKQEYIIRIPFKPECSVGLQCPPYLLAPLTHWLDPFSTGPFFEFVRENLNVGFAAGLNGFRPYLKSQKNLPFS